MAVKPMLAQAVTSQDLSRLRYPLIVQLKYDGIRAIIASRQPQSRSGKILPNVAVRDFFWELSGLVDINGLDGELIVGDPADKAVCMNTTSGVMSVAGSPNFKFHIFDWVLPQTTYIKRYEHMCRMYEKIQALAPRYADRIALVPNLLRLNVEDTYEAISLYVNAGHEGAILRDPDGIYKHGRSTLKQGALLKYKDIQDAEAWVIGFDELHHNHNEAQLSDLGFTKRSSHQANQVAGNKLGALVVWSPKWPGIFKIGTGFDDAQRHDIWRRRDELLYKPVTFRYLAAGIKSLPRHPVFKLWRAPKDQDAIEMGIFKRLEQLAYDYERRER